ncbi:MAG: nitroreductase family protein [Deltaproteobacteria bacterium]|nr:nitroreductase family protein [Deltaproteobacteria bacterium]MBQ6669470.1 nitroreductase family protein [Deltaproteobacteria bacterium]
MEIIFQRRSVRHFQERPVEPEKIEQILRAAMAAPSSFNQQPWEFFVVGSREKLEALSQISPYAGPAARAPLAIVVACRPDCRFQGGAPLDLAACVENMWLETVSQGLGGVWLGVAPRPERMNKVAEILPLPEELSAFAVFPLGYPTEDEAHRERETRFKPERIHYIG